MHLIKLNASVSIICVLMALFLSLPIPSSSSFSCTVASGASGSFSTNSPASPLSSVSLTSPLSPFSPVPGSQASPTKQLGPEVSTGHTQPGTNPNSKLSTNPFSDCRANPEVHRRLSPKPRPKSCIVPHFQTNPKPRYRPKSCREPDASQYAEHVSEYGCETHEHTFPQSSLVLQNLRETLGRLDPVMEETDQNVNSTVDQSIHLNPAKVRAEEQVSGLQRQCQDCKYTNQHSDKGQTHSHLQKICWLTSDCCLEELRVGLRKDVYPDCHPSHFSVGYSNRLKDLSSKRRFSMPESKIVLLQDSYETGVLSLHYSPDSNAPSFPCIRSVGHETQHQHQLASQCHDKAGARPLTYPNNQGELDFDPVICAITQSDSPSKHSSTVFMQTHL